MKIKEIVLYYETVFKTDSGIDSILKEKVHTYTDSNVMLLLEKAKRTNEFFLWKGSISGVIIYENGDSTKLKISRYGAYFMNLTENQSYSFPNKELKNQWIEFINSFLNMPSKNQ